MLNHIELLKLIQGKIGASITLRQGVRDSIKEGGIKWVRSQAADFAADKKAEKSVIEKCQSYMFAIEENEKPTKSLVDFLKVAFDSTRMDVDTKQAIADYASMGDLDAKDLPTRKQYDTFTRSLREIGKETGVKYKVDLRKPNDAKQEKAVPQAPRNEPKSEQKSDASDNGDEATISLARHTETVETMQAEIDRLQAIVNEQAKKIEASDKKAHDMNLKIKGYEKNPLLKQQAI